MRGSAFIVVVLTACRPASVVTYAADVAPLIETKCVRCHGAAEGASVPPSLVGYEQLRANADLVALSARRRSMPPWLPDESGSCGSFGDSPALTAAEISVLQRFAEGERPLGEPRQRRSTADLARAEPAVVLDPGVELTPTPGRSAYWCLAVGALEEPLLITEAGPSPSGLGAVDQLSLYALSSAAEPVSPCDGPPASAELILRWSSATPTLRLPTGTAVLLPARRPLLLQVHVDFLAAGLAPTLHPHLALWSGKGEPGRFFAVGAAGFLPNGEREAWLHASTHSAGRLRMHGVIPQMGAPGRSMKLARPGECLAYFGHWDRYRAQLFALRQPIDVGEGEALRVACSFNTLSLEAEQREECSALLFVTDY